MGLLNKLIDFDPIIDRAVDRATAQIPVIIEAVEKRVQALLPVLAAAAAKAVVDKFPDLVKAILERDPDIPGVSDVFDLSETIRNGVNGGIPDIDIPRLSDIIDLTEILNQALKPKP